MMMANAPVVLAGERIARRVPARPIHAIAALRFLALRALVLLGTGRSIG